MEVRTASCQETQALAGCLGLLAQPGMILVLEGPLGAGKTSFLQGFAQGLGVTGVVNSPTFTLIKEYWGRLPFFHFDLYRLEEAEELWDLGFDEYMSKGGVCALEWGERVVELLPKEYILLRFSYAGENQRLIQFFPVGDRHGAFVKELERSAGPSS